MKARDLRPCDACAQPLGLVFQVLRCSMAVVDARAARTAHGEQVMMGPLAGVLGTDPEVAVVLADKDPAAGVDLILCMDCYALKPVEVAHLVEKRTRAIEVAKAKEVKP